MVVRFPTAAGRDHFVWYANQGLLNPAWALATSNPIAGTGGIVEWTDDGTHTAPALGQTTDRVYRIEYSVPQ